MPPTLGLDAGGLVEHVRATGANADRSGVPVWAGGESSGCLNSVLSV
jgi:hypothetical protein